MRMMFHWAQFCQDNPLLPNAAFHIQRLVRDMTQYISDLCHVTAIAGAGRGVVASQALSNGTQVLSCSQLGAHVIFREYRRECCANCFYYDRGRNLPIRVHEYGKVFCSDQCRSSWVEKTGSIGLEAWSRLTSFINANTKHTSSPAEEDLRCELPSTTDIDEVWSNSAAAGIKDPRKIAQIDPDVLCFFLSAVLTHRFGPAVWSSLLRLTMDERPYKSLYELQGHKRSYQQLLNVVPDPLESSCTSNLCRIVVQAASHNAFGIRSGGEDNEEYMGYAVYPQASYFNHSCEPNLSKQRHGTSWHFSCNQDIAKDQELCISYLGGDEKDLDVTARRAKLASVWGFECQCQRCQEESRTHP